MEDILDKVVSNNSIFAGVIIVLCIILVGLIILIVRSYKENKKINIYEEDLEDDDIKKVKNVKKEDIIETPDNSPFEDETLVENNILDEKNMELAVKDIATEEVDKELKERYDDEYEKEMEEIKEENRGNEIEKILDKMEADNKLKPEDVVANFEKEQEAQSIISYKELVDAVKKRQEDIYEDELESRPLTTVSDFMKQKEAKELENSASLDNNLYDNYEIKKDSKIEKKEETTKFKRTDIISPVFGRIESGEADEKTVISNNKTKEEKKYQVVAEDEESTVTALDEVYRHMAEDLMKNNEEFGGSTSLEDLTKNEEFLQSLKNFRKNL